MGSPPSIDPFASNRVPFRRNIAPVLLRTMVMDQRMAVPVALVLTSAGSDFRPMLVVATVYAQTIGLCCSISTFFTIRWLDAQPSARAHMAIMGQYFACGLLG